MLENQNMDNNALSMMKLRIQNLERKNAMSHEKKEATMISEICKIIEEEYDVSQNN